jgi:DNA topoisomerase-1
MAKSLVIVESPAKAKTINKYLGKDYVVTASVGHIIDLPPNRFGVNIEGGFKPEYVKIKGKEKTISELRTKAKDALKVYLATDPDREGEAIAFHISTILDRDNDSVFRVEFNEITKNAVDAAMQAPRPIDMPRVYSQQARRVLDRIVGYKISPVLWETIYKGSLSAGRVQSVALRLICQREEEIVNFKSEEFWLISLMVTSENSPPFQIKLIKIASKKVSISDQTTAEKYSTEIRQQGLIISSIEKKEVKRQPPPPFITSTLQQVASRMLRMTTSRIMAVAQSLYEGVDIPGHGSLGLITYMRTDSTRISEEAVQAARDYIAAQFGPDYVPGAPRRYQSKKTAQDAHEAIRPTYIREELSPENLKAHLTKEQYRLYDLIWKRFVACQMPSAIYEKTIVTVQGGRFEFNAEGEILQYAGYTRIYNEEPEEETDENSALPKGLREKAPCELVDLKAEQNFTKPLPRYTESTLVKELDRLGIGRPSTYAQIVSTIQQRKYVEVQERKLFATELGLTVNKILVGSFPDIFNVAYTADMEEKLDAIANNEASYEQVLTDFFTPLSQALKETQARKKEIKSDLIEESGISCEKCGKPMMIRWGRNGRFLACSGFPECKNTRPLEEKQSEPETTGEQCEKCGHPMVIKTGRFGKFLACSNYPTCKNTKPIKVSTGVSCPKDGCKGQIVQRKTKRGRVFYGCSNYPKCDFVSWYKPVNQPCPACNNNYIEDRATKAKGALLRCPVCKHEIIPENNPAT